MKRLPIVKDVGSKVFVALKEFFAGREGSLSKVLATIGCKERTAVDEDLRQGAASVLRDVLTPLATSYKELETDARVKTPVDVPLLELWRCAAKDPDDQPTRWLSMGAPAGLR